MNLEAVLAPFAATYAARPMKPWRIELTLDTPVVAYENLHFDGLLSYLVMEQATQGQIPPTIDGYLTVPLPLKALWQAESWTGDLVPLWAATDLLPVQPPVRDELWLHRRALEPTMTRQNIRSDKGRHKEKRTPLPVLANRVLACDVIGHAQTIADLLRHCASIGKKRHIAGSIQAWRITPVLPFSLIDSEGRLRRPLPRAALYPDGHPLDVEALHLAYSPPYWHPSTRALCLPEGAYLPEGARRDW